MARTVPVVLATAFVISVVHYLDNFVRFHAYAKNPDTPITPILVPVGWVVFTAAGACGYLLFRRGRTTAAARCLAFYALSGLIGIGHYRDAPPTAFDPFQNVFIVTDIVLGLVVLVLAIRIGRPPRLTKKHHQEGDLTSP